MALSGVRISWLIFCKNRILVASDSSARFSAAVSCSFLAARALRLLRRLRSELSVHRSTISVNTNPEAKIMLRVCDLLAERWYSASCSFLVDCSSCKRDSICSNRRALSRLSLRALMRCISLWFRSCSSANSALWSARLLLRSSSSAFSAFSELLPISAFICAYWLLRIWR